MSDPVPQSTAPGADILEQALEAYHRLWNRHLDTVNEVWRDITSKDADISSWTSGCSKLMQAWTENAREVFALFGANLHRAHGAPETPVLSFVLDPQTEASKEQSLPLPHGVDPQKIVSTKLSALDGAPPLPQLAQVAATIDAELRSIDITIAGLGTAVKQGNYFAVVYEQLAAAASPPRRALALVIVSFLAA